MQTTTQEPSFLTRTGASAFLEELGFPIAPSYLAKLAHTGGGPVYQIYGNRALYRPENLLRWAESRLSAPLANTSQRAGVVAQ